jgi:hypothetical protein
VPSPKDDDNVYLNDDDVYLNNDDVYLNDDDVYLNSRWMEEGELKACTHYPLMMMMLT